MERDPRLRGDDTANTCKICRDIFMNIQQLPAFQDNYLWLVETGHDAVAVDPGDAKPVLAYLQETQQSLAAILLTHHHADHVGGVSN